MCMSCWLIHSALASGHQNSDLCDFLLCVHNIMYECVIIFFGMLTAKQNLATILLQTLSPSSGVETVVAIAALATTLFNLYALLLTAS